MCGIATNTKPKKQIEQTFGAQVIDVWESFTPIAKAFAFDTLPIITQEQPSVIQLFAFGLLPNWAQPNADGVKLRTQTINARSETIFEKPSFKNSIINKKCLILVDGFIEYQHIGKEKQAYYISLKNEPLFAMAGIYNVWQQDGVTHKTFSIVTVPANELMAQIHNSKLRMPLILQKEDYNNWLQTNNMEQTKTMFYSFNNDAMQAHAISNNIGKTTANKKDCNLLQPISIVKQESLF